MGGRFTKPRPTSARVSGTGRHAGVTVEDKYTRPTGLYVHKSIDFSRLRKLILAGRLAPCFAGLEECAEGTMEECPICMLVRHCGGTPAKRQHRLEATTPCARWGTHRRGAPRPQRWRRARRVWGPAGRGWQAARCLPARSGA